MSTPRPRPAHPSLMSLPSLPSAAKRSQLRQRCPIPSSLILSTPPIPLTLPMLPFPSTPPQILKADSQQAPQNLFLRDVISLEVCVCLPLAQCSIYTGTTTPLSILPFTAIHSLVVVSSTASMPLSRPRLKARFSLLQAPPSAFISGYVLCRCEFDADIFQ
ncbi:hypothetical protein C8F01DRAFT_1142531 [Mycena amicta]|nr:hypothetical protein C8F01DRAFT_1142531 [Mycena amicta]